MSSLKRAFQILDLINQKSINFASLYNSLQLPKSTLWTILKQLEEIGAIQKDDNGEYQLGTYMLRLGLSSSNHISVVKELAQPIMSKLAKETKEICLLAILDKEKFEIIYVSKVEGESPIHVKVSIGSSNPCYCTSSGKIFLSLLSKGELDKYLETVTLKKYTSKTITDKNELLMEIEKIRSNGYAIDRGEHIEYSLAISSPIYDHRGKCVAVIVISGLNQRMGEKLDVYIPLVKQSANEISELIGNNSEQS